MTVDNLSESQECIVSQSGAVIPVTQPSKPPEPEPEPEPPKSPEKPPEPPKEVVRIIPGYLAVCSHCGYLSEDFNKCQRCRTKMPDEPKAIPSSTTLNKQTEQKGTKTVKVGMLAGKLTPKLSSK